MKMQNAGVGKLTGLGSGTATGTADELAPKKENTS